jgi:hypothetical protein
LSRLHVDDATSSLTLKIIISISKTLIWFRLEIPTRAPLRRRALVESSSNLFDPDICLGESYSRVLELLFPMLFIMLIPLDKWQHFCLWRSFAYVTNHLKVRDEKVDS